MIESGTRAWLEDVKFIDEKSGVVVGDKGTILRTVDGGLTWKKIKTNLKENLYALSFYDEKIGFAVGANGTILRTTTAAKLGKIRNRRLTCNLYAVKAYRRE